jgi:hypothetical protein
MGLTWPFVVAGQRGGYNLRAACVGLRRPVNPARAGPPEATAIGDTRHATGQELGELSSRRYRSSG